MNDRTAEELAAGILERVPDTAKVKAKLKRRLKKILASSTPDPKYAAPEVKGLYNQRRIRAICEACSELLGNSGKVAWKKAVEHFVNRTE